MSDAIVTVIIHACSEIRHVSDCIHSLVTQTLPIDKYQIILVDRATDGSNMLSEAIKKPMELSIERFHLPELGIEHENDALASLTKTPLIAILDSYAIAQPGWLEKITKPFKQDKKPAVVGGETIANWETKRPDWLADQWLNTFLVKLGWSSQPRSLDLDEWLSFGNVCFTREAFGRLKSVIRTPFCKSDHHYTSGKLYADVTSLSENRLLFEPAAITERFIPRDWATPRWLAKAVFQAGVESATRTERLRQKDLHAEGWVEMKLPTTHQDWAQMINLYTDHTVNQTLTFYQNLGYCAYKAGLSSSLNI